VVLSEYVAAESFTFDIQMAGYDHSKYDAKGPATYEVFLNEFKCFPWLQQLKYRNSMTEGTSATISVKDINGVMDYWVSIAGDETQHAYIIGIVFTKEIERLRGFVAPKKVKWVQAYISESNVPVEKTAKYYFDSDYAKLTQSLNKLDLFLNQEAPE